MSSSKRKSGGGDANVRRAKSSRSLETPAKLQEYPWIGQITELLPGSIPFACCHLYFGHWGLIAMCYVNICHSSSFRFESKVVAMGPEEWLNQEFPTEDGVCAPLVSCGTLQIVLCDF